MSPDRLPRVGPPGFSLGLLLAVGVLLPGDRARLAPRQWVAPLPLFAGAMVIFLNYEGFELIANAVPQAIDPKRSLRIAYLDGTAIVLLFYIAIVSLVLVHASFADIALHSDSVLSLSARFSDRLDSILAEPRDVGSRT